MDTKILKITKAAHKKLFSQKEGDSQLYMLGSRRSIITAAIKLRNSGWLSSCANATAVDGQTTAKAYLKLVKANIKYAGIANVRGKYGDYDSRYGPLTISFRKIPGGYKKYKLKVVN